MASFVDTMFPKSERVIYEHAPLLQVICQVRFPSLLRIESAPPAEFQELIRADFPLFERGPSITLPLQLPPELAQAFGAQLSNVTYQFHTEDRSSTLSLTPDALSLTTLGYVRWEGFKSHLLPALRALETVYRPSFFSRIGLRYINAIERKKLGLQTASWARLIRKEVLGLLSFADVEANVVEAKGALRIKTADEGQAIFLQHGLGQLVGQTETCYTIDFDLYTEQKVETTGAEPILDEFHDKARRAFRWAITDTLHDALGPRPATVGVAVHA